MCTHCKGFSRRGFMEVVSAGAALGAATMAGGVGAVAAPAQPAAPKPKVRVGRIYLAMPSSGWPKPNLDLKADVAHYEQEFARLAPAFADVEFVDAGLATTPAQVAAAKEKFRGVDGILALHLNCGVTGYLTNLMELNVPLVFFAMPYAGHE